MEMIGAHDDRGLTLLHDRYATLLKGLSMKVLHNDADAEDLLQDVFLEIRDRVGSYNPLKGRPLSWIATLIRRRSIDRLRKRETYERLQDGFAEETKQVSTGRLTHVHESSPKVKGANTQRAPAILARKRNSTPSLSAYHGE